MKLCKIHWRKFARDAKYDTFPFKHAYVRCESGARIFLEKH